MDRLDDTAAVAQFSCGLIMPISAIANCSAEHWAEVKGIVTESVESIRDPHFAVKLVSEADDVGVIQKRIVQNIYNSDVVVCDVSGKNPNVMFELGLRLAFDKPTVIIKDDQTDYSFDTAIIEHVPYPRDLRFAKIVTFKALLAEKVAATYKASKTNPDHSTFLKNFGKFHVASLSQDVVPADKLVVSLLTEMQEEFARLRRDVRRSSDHSGLRPRRGSGDRVEGMSRIYRVLSEIIADNPKVDLRALLNPEDRPNELVTRCDAPRYFPVYSEFQDALRRAIEDIEATRRATDEVKAST